MRKLFILLCIPAIFSTSCREFFGKRVRGDGNFRTDTRSVGSFSSVEVGGAIDLYVKQDAAQSVKIEADGNLLEYIDSYLEGDKLVVRTKDGFNLKPSRDIKVSVSASLFKRIEASGSCDVFTENQLVSNENLSVSLSGSCDAKMDIKAPSVETDISGACSVQLKGETKNLKAGGSGSVDFKCFDMLAENVSVDISGAGDAEVYASQKLDVDVSGAAGVKYKGNATVNQHVSGAGSVKKVD